MLSASGFSYSLDDDVTPDQSKLSPSLRPITEISGSDLIDYAQAINFISAPNSEDGRYQENDEGDLSLEDAVSVKLGPDPGQAIEMEDDRSENERAGQHMVGTTEDSVYSDSSQHTEKEYNPLGESLTGSLEPDQTDKAGMQDRENQGHRLERAKKRCLSGNRTERSSTPAKRRPAPHGGYI